MNHDARRHVPLKVKLTNDHTRVTGQCDCCIPPSGSATRPVVEVRTCVYASVRTLAEDVRHPQDKLCAKDPGCKVYGLSPSSTIPFVATVSGLCCAVLMPLVGAFVDHSPKRWEALVAKAALLIAANALQVSLGPRTGSP